MNENSAQTVIRKLYALRREQEAGVIEIASNDSRSGSDFLQNPEDYILKGNTTLEKKIFKAYDESIVSEVKQLIDNKRTIIIIAYPTQYKLELYSYIKINNIGSSNR